jgi:hypothetical protein
MLANRYGLRRAIPEEIKRMVRKRCGFGCVLCGASITHYDHIDPPFKDAQVHEATGIALVCPKHHDWVTRGYLSREKVLKASLNPFCNQAGYAHSELELGPSYPFLVFAGSTIWNVPIPVIVRGEPLFQIKGPEEPRGPISLCANFHNSEGWPSLEIVHNEWRAYARNWDVDVEGGAVTIRDGPRHVSLRLVLSHFGGVIVEQLDMRIKDLRLIGSPRQLDVKGPNLDWTISRFEAHNGGLGLVI